MMPTINVYISGPESNEKGDISLAKVLHTMTNASEYESFYESPQKSSHYISAKISSNGISLQQQLDTIIKKIRETSKTGALTLNLYGYKTAGAMTFWLCKQLKDISPQNIIINVCAFDPVPENYVRASYLSKVLGLESTTLAAQIADLSGCENIGKMLILFINDPLPDINYQAPLLPILPKQAKFTLDVLPGPHKDADSYCDFGDGKLEAKSNCSVIAFHYVRHFFEECGTTFNNNRYAWENRIDPNNPNNDVLKSLLQNENKNIKNLTRHMHFYNEIQSKQGQLYLNLLHRRLEGQEKKTTQGCALSVKYPDPQANYWNGQQSHPYGPTAVASAALFTGAYCLYNLPIVSAPLAMAYLYNKYKPKPNPKNSELQEVSGQKNETAPRFGYKS